MGLGRRLTVCSSVSDSRTWGQGRAMEAEEEDYFLHDDDEDPPIVRIIQDPTPQAMQPLKRKRARPTGIAGTPIAKFARGAKAKAAPVLVDYAGDDDDGEPTSGDEAAPPSQSPSPAPDTAGPSRGASPAADLPPSPRIAHREVPLRASARLGARSPPDPDAAMQGTPASPSLLVARTPVPTGAPVASVLTGLSPLRAGEKRRRAGEADEDDSLERLAAKRRSSLDAAPAKKDDAGGARKLKLKLGSTAAAPAPAPGATHTGAKDGDTG
jgi:protein phosphatase-4 regulatory subunit 3